MPEPAREAMDEQQPTPLEQEVARRRAMALKEWLSSELGEERAMLTGILAKHRVQVAGGGDEAKALLQDLLEWKADFVTSSKSAQK